MYTTIDFSTKKSLKAAVAAGERVTVFSPSPFDPRGIMESGHYFIEGPHEPKPHTWYAQVVVAHGTVISVK